VNAVGYSTEKKENSVPLRVLVTVFVREMRAD
jgi:hypothetical protein